MMKRLILVLIGLTAILCEGSLSWSATGIVDESGNKPANGAFVGYFVPTYTDRIGTIIDKQSFIELLQTGDYYVLSYMGGQTFNTGNSRICRMVSESWYDDSMAFSTVRGFAIIFNSYSVETATAFFATDEVSAEVGSMDPMTTTSGATFNFGSLSGMIMAYGWQSMYAPIMYTASFNTGEHGAFADVHEYGYRSAPFEWWNYPSDYEFSFEATPPEIAPYDGWRFVGWRDDSTHAFYPVGSDVVVMSEYTCFDAEYEECAVIPKYAVTFNIGAHGTRTGGGELTQTVTNGYAAVAPTVSAEQGWEFMGWATTSGGSVVYGNREVISPAADMSLYAVWKLHLAVFSKRVAFNANGGTVSVTVETGEDNENWTAMANVNWLTVTKVGNKVRITATANEATSLRRATVVVSTEDELYAVSVGVTQQRVASFLEISPSKTEFPSNGGSGSVSISANDYWEAVAWNDEVDDFCDWIELSADYGNGDGSFTFNVSENTSSGSRSATIYVYCDDEEQSFTVSQSAASTPDDNLLSLSPESIVLDWYECGPFEVEVSSTAFWFIDTADDWIHFWGGTDPRVGNDVITFDVDANYTGSTRTGEILFYCMDQIVSVMITQYPNAAEPPGGDLIVLSTPSEMLYDGQIGISTSFYVEHTGGGSWHVAEYESWLEIMNLYGESEELGWAARLDDSQWISYIPRNTVNVWATEENLTGDTRIGYVYIWDDYGNNAVFTVMQPPSVVVPPDPMPTVSENAGASAVTNAIESAGFADEVAVKAAIGGSAEEYGKFKTWAGSVVGGEAAVVANTNAAAAYLLGAERLFENAPTIEFGSVEVRRQNLDAPSGGGGAVESCQLTFSVVVKDGEEAVACAANKVAAMFEATGDLGDWNGSKLTPAVEQLGTVDGAMRFKVMPPTTAGSSFFMRVKVK